MTSPHRIYIKVRGQWRYLYRAIDKHGTPVDFLLTAKRDLDAAKRFFRKMLQDQPLLAPTGSAQMGRGPTRPPSRQPGRTGLLARTPVHYVTKHLQQGIESDHFRVKRPMPRVGGFRSFHTARRTIQGFEAMLWLRKGFGFAGAWTVREQNRLLALCFGLPAVNKVVKTGPIQPILRPAPEFATTPSAKPRPKSTLPSQLNFFSDRL